MNNPRKRAELANLVPHGEVFLELGVAAGKFAEQVLGTNPDLLYVGVDRWSDHHDEQEMARAMDRIDSVGRGRSTIIRSSFADALNNFKDGSVFLIYVDGYAHTGQDGGRTLCEWWPKLQPGGIFCGHDYDTARYPQTVEAVDRFASLVGTAPTIIDENPHPSWWMRKPAFSSSAQDDNEPVKHRTQ